MDAEKTMEFILVQQAQFEANFAKADKRLDRLERLSAQSNRLVAKLAGYGRTLRSDIHRHEKRVAAAHVRAEQAYERDESAGEYARQMKAELDAAMKSLARTLEQFMRRNGN
jgi:hypothetical protein